MWASHFSKQSSLILTCAGALQHVEILNLVLSCVSTDELIMLCDLTQLCCLGGLHLLCE